MKRLMMVMVTLVAVLFIAGIAQANLTAGFTGTMTIISPNSENGASASLWGFYKNGGWANATFGTGTFTDGIATISYTIPTDYVSDFYWNAIAKYSPTRSEKTQYEVFPGAWDQFFTDDPSGKTVNVKTYMFDQTSVTLTSASFRASAKGATVFPDAALAGGEVTVYRPWTGTMAQYTDSTEGVDSYYSNGKKGLAPTYAASKGYTVDVLEGNPAATQEFQKILLHNADNTYSVELFAYKNISTDDPLGYIWWTTLKEVTTASCVYDGATGIFSGTFASPLDSGPMYFVDPWVYEYDSLNPTEYSSVSGMGATDLLLGGTTSIPTAITLASFDANAGNGKVTLNWVTGDETDNLGFNIYRADAQDGEYVKINASLIASKVGSGLGTSYEFTDSGVQNRTTYSYKLEDVDVNGTATQHGPLAATPRFIYGLFQ